MDLGLAMVGNSGGHQLHQPRYLPGRIRTAWFDSVAIFAELSFAAMIMLGLLQVNKEVPAPAGSRRGASWIPW